MAQIRLHRPSVVARVSSSTAAPRARVEILPPPTMDWRGAGPAGLDVGLEYVAAQTAR